MLLVIYALEEDTNTHTYTQTNAFWENNLYKTGVHQPQAGAPGLIMTEVIIITLIM